MVVEPERIAELNVTSNVVFEVFVMVTSGVVDVPGVLLLSFNSE